MRNFCVNAYGRTSLLLNTGPPESIRPDAATPELPLGRLLRLSLFQVSVGMATVLLIGTLNRVMIVELGVPASLVAVMLSVPLVFAPFRALIGFKSDTHRITIYSIGENKVDDDGNIEDGEMQSLDVGYSVTE